MSFEDKFAKFNLTNEAIENFQAIAKLYEDENNKIKPFLIKTEVILTQDNISTKLIK